MNTAHSASLHFKEMETQKLKHTSPYAGAATLAKMLICKRKFIYFRFKTVKKIWWKLE